MTGGQFFEQFIEDYFAECEEHLTAIRRVLLALEQQIGTVPAAVSLQELFRSLHTIKGLSGMVGLASAERLAHVMESGLRAAGPPDSPVDPRLVDSLFAGTRLLERCIAARRSGTEPPDVSEFVADLGTSVARPSRAEAVAPPRAAPVSGEPTKAANTCLFEFEPSPELARRGVGVDHVRARLRSVGKLIDAKPRVVGSGGVVFDFVVVLHAGATPDESWRADGLTWRPHLATEPALPARGRPADVSASGATAATEAPVGAASGSSVVRVDLTRVDELMRLVGELVVSRARLEDALRDAVTRGADAVLDSLYETNDAMERQLRGLREGVMRIRLVPVGEIFERMRFALREVSRETGKQVALDLRGQTTEIDKLIVERMLEPLLHLVRNAVSHGIESPEERRARGKPAEGRLTLSAAASGDRVVIEVEDDGAGIDVERVAARARDRGLLRPDEQPDDDALLDLLCAPGLSTRDEADLASGRGVGMDVVRSAVRGLAGELRLSTTPGRGTRFTVEVPLTLMIVEALLLEVGDQSMAVPQLALREVLQVDTSELTRFESNEVIPYRGGVLPLLSLRRLFGVPESDRASIYVLVVGSDASATGLVVDRLVGVREIVVQPVVDPLIAVPGIGGATELGDGRVSLILDAPALVRLSRERREQRAARVA